MKKSGFTLIELLVVISIIGILATLLMANVAGVRERARDAQRKSDINQIQKALEMYKNSLATPAYPTTSGWRTALESGTNPAMKTVPHDPKCGWDSVAGACTTTWPDYSYTRDPEGSGDTLTYKIIACLENASDPQKDGTNTCSTGYSFTRREP
ncbi:MAG: type II secretion system protein [Patescibacteria group bacterium]